MMEPIVFKKNLNPKTYMKDWALTGAKGRKRNIIKSFYPVKGELEEFNAKLQKKYRQIKAEEVRYEEINAENADIVIVAYGTCARICKEVIKSGETAGIKIGMLRPITLWPFPSDVIQKISERVQAILTVEMSAGQMVEDVRLSVLGRCQVHFYGRTGGGIPTPKQVIEKVLEITSVKEEAACIT
jgi:2-oxoglutarate ferredoxin oxidoreductase subunit alpha